MENAYLQKNVYPNHVMNLVSFTTFLRGVISFFLLLREVIFILISYIVRYYIA